MAFDEQSRTDGWQTYSDWIDKLRNDSRTFSNYDNDSSFKERLKACKSNLERFQLVWRDTRIRKELDKHCSRDCKQFDDERAKKPNVKSAEESKKMREMGNKSYKSNNFYDALSEYSKAVKFAPYPDETCQDDCLALALANRSAALFSLKKYRLCLSDIDLALKYGYPEANKFKLMIRKIKCLHILSIWDNDVEQIKEDLKTMIKRPGTKEAIKNEVNALFEFINQGLPDTNSDSESDAEDENAIKISNVSKTLPQAADCVEMSYEPDKGRYLLTNKDVSSGRLLIAEDPFVCNLAPSMRQQYCYHCFERLHDCGLSCQNCTQVLYCSLDCLNKNTFIHKLECNKLLDFHEKLGVAYLVVHIMLKIDFNLESIPICSKKLVEQKSLDDVLNIKNSNWPDLVFKNDYAALLSLMDHAEDYDYDSMMGYVLTAAYLVTLFVKYQPTSRKDVLKSEESQLIIGSVVLRHMMQLQTNLIAVLCQGYDSGNRGWQFYELPEEPIGVGLYPTISLLNHSCEPNILSIFRRNKFIARASTSLECGTEINYCYGPSVARVSKKDRQKRLLEQYYFTCNCGACANNRENCARAVICPKCKGDVIYNQDKTHKCLGCQRENFMDIGERLSNVRYAETLLYYATEKPAHMTGSMKSRLTKLTSIEKQFTKLVHWRNPVFVRIKDAKIECAEEFDKHDLALQYCEEGLELCEKINGKDSYESINATLSYIHLKWLRLYHQAEESGSGERQGYLGQLRELLTTISKTRSNLKDLLNSTSIAGAEKTYGQEFSFLTKTAAAINKYLVSNEAPEIDT